MLRTLARVFVALCLVGAIVWLVGAGHFLVVDEPNSADAMLVLEGENDVRVQRGLKLLHAGRAPLLILNAVADMRVFGITKPVIAEEFVKTLPPADAARIRICPITALSTQQEARAAGVCLRDAGVHTVLLVTSDYHTRRARMIFRHELPQFDIHAAAAPDPKSFGQKWWTDREWAKTMLSETSRTAWFQLVDRWR